MNAPFVSWVTVARECRAEVSATARLVLYALASRAEGRASGVAWPSIAQLVLDTGLSRRSIFNALAALEQARVIERASDAGRTMAWRILRPAEVPCSEDGGVHHVHSGCTTCTESAPGAPPESTPSEPGVHHVHSECTTCTEGGAPRALKVHQVHGGVHHVHPEVSNEVNPQSAPPSGAAPGAPAVGALPTSVPWQPSDAWLERARDAEGGVSLGRVMTTAILERKALHGLLAEAGFDEAAVTELWPRVAEHWAAMGERPTAWAKRVKPRPGDELDLPLAEDATLLDVAGQIGPAGKAVRSA